MRSFCLPAMVVIGLVVSQARGEAPLPSWNDGPAKAAVLNFVSGVTTKGSADFVPPDQRIATFDNDGTLWCEQPVVQLSYVLHRLTELAKKDPDFRNRQPFKAAFEGDKEYLKHAGAASLFKLMAVTHADMSDGDFKRQVRTFFAKAKHPTLNVPYQNVAYQPMLELLAYLRANDFKIYICSGGGIDFMRVISQQVYGIPPSQVIGSSLKKELVQRDGKWVLKRFGELGSFNDKEQKPVNIDLHIGQRPLLAVGNVRSGGDIGMLNYSHGRSGPSLQLLINHDDAKREFVYSEKDNASLKAAKDGGWIVVSMNKDWKSIFSLKTDKSVHSK